MMIVPQILASVLGIVVCFAASAYGATLLSTDEVDGLKQIAKTLGQTNWNFSVDPCSGQMGWAIQNPATGSESSVTCNCSIPNDTFCHVTSITLKQHNLPGTLPPELVKLPYLQIIDLTRNYLNGTIPPEWASLPLRNISLLGNRLTGSIPKEFGNISTLTYLTLEFNQLSGALPPELGNLSSIEYLHLTSNNFTGELPETLAKLTTLKDFRISDNQFTGRIPNFIQNWINLDRLLIQASGLDGPIPTGISLLTKLSDLRISDLYGSNGSQATFPPLKNMANLDTLVLRSCNINGSIPEYLWAMTTLTMLDLSFNNLSGVIPDSSISLKRANYIFLTGNLLSGLVPDWILQEGNNIDLSYNNFSSEPASCQPRESVNLFGSSSKGNTSGLVSCMRSVNCPQKWYSFNINCGGKEEIIDGNTKYEGDTDSGGPSKFFQSGTNWAFSSVGHFLDVDSRSDAFISENTSTLSANSSPLSMNARLSAISLTYYGFCLAEGNYTVYLHFAEIMFTDDKTYSSLGRRIFDVYVQGKLVLKDFNIEDEAGGVGKEIVKNISTVVTNGTLEIRFNWAGKGTTGIPKRGVYGPLISAISVKSGTPPDNGTSISAGAVVGMVVAITFVIILLLGSLWWKGFLNCKDTLDQDLRGLDLQTGSFTLSQIKAATNNFDPANKLGEGGFGSVYKGLLSDGTLIAVKQLSSKSKQGNREFLNEIGMISALQHPHLVKLYGCCIEGNQLLLVYEYMENNSLARALFGPEEFRLNLDWPTRYNICIGIARGLAYMHEESRLKIVHRDIKPTNVLLDKNLNAKISDFGMAKLDEEDNTHISTRIAGTYGYMAPEYAMRGYLTDKADVYSFGIVALEIVSGTSNTSCKPKEDSFYLLDWVLVLKGKGNLMELVDPALGSDFNTKEVMVMINVALRCANVSLAVRPTMSSVVSMLESRTVKEELVWDPTVSSEGTTIELQRQYSCKTDTSEGQTQSMLPEGPCTGSSVSTSDLYPINIHSDFLSGRLQRKW